MSKIFKPRRGKRSTMLGTKASTVLAAGELFYELPDSGVGTGACRVKLGDGVTAYSSLPYADQDITTSEITTITADNSTTASAALANVVANKSLSSLLGSLKQACELNRQAIATLNDDTAKPVVGRRYQAWFNGSQVGSMAFVCAAKSGNTYYFIGTESTCGKLTWTGANNTSNYIKYYTNSLPWSDACAQTWTVVFSFGTASNCKIPTKAEADLMNRSLRAIGFWYWTSTAYDGSHAWHVDHSGYVYHDTDMAYTNGGVVPLAKLTF